MFSRTSKKAGRDESRPRRCGVALLLGMWIVMPAFAGVTVGAGSTLNFADGSVSLGCGDLAVAGQAVGTSGQIAGIADLGISAGGMLAPGAGSLLFGGNFSDAGTFAPGTSRMRVVDACGGGTTAISGAASFYDLAVDSASGKLLVLPAGVTETIAHAFSLTGTAGSLLQVSSSSAGQRALLNVSTAASQNIAYVNVRDNDASGAPIAPGAASVYHSVDGGNLLNWFAAAVTGQGTGAVAAPLLGDVGRMILFGSLFGAAYLGLRRRRESPRMSM